jgi:uncharacterized protein
MPLYVMFGRDGGNGPAIRASTRPAHLAWLDSLGAAVRLAGPLQGDDGGSPTGSMILVEAESLAAAKALFAEDPYAREGLWARQDILPFVQVRP